MFASKACVLWQYRITCEALGTPTAGKVDEILVEQPEPGPTPVPSPSIYCEKFIIDAGARTITIDDSEWDSLSAE